MGIRSKIARALALAAFAIASVVSVGPTVALADTGSGSSGGTSTWTYNFRDWGMDIYNIWNDGSDLSNPPAGTTFESNKAYWSNLIKRTAGVSQLYPDSVGGWADAYNSGIQGALDDATNNALAHGAAPEDAVSHVVGVAFIRATAAHLGAYPYPLAAADNLFLQNIQAHVHTPTQAELPSVPSQSGRQVILDYGINHFKKSMQGGNHMTRYLWWAITPADCPPPHPGKKTGTATSSKKDVVEVGQTADYDLTQKLRKNSSSLTFTDTFDDVFDVSDVKFTVTRTYKDASANYTEKTADVTSQFELSKDGNKVTVKSKDTTTVLGAGTYDCHLYDAKVTANSLANHTLITDQGDPHYGCVRIDNKTVSNYGESESAPIYTHMYYFTFDKGSDAANVPAWFEQNGYSGTTYTIYTDAACTQVAKTTDNLDATITVGKDGKGALKYFTPGTYYVKETAAPTGFVLDGTPIKVDLTSVTATGQKQVIAKTDTAQATIGTGSDGIEVDVRQQDKAIMGGVSLRKVDKDVLDLHQNGSGDSSDSTDYDPTRPEGSATLSGAEFKVYNVSGTDITIAGKVYKSTTAGEKADDACVITIRTGDDGSVKTAADALVYGRYLLVETKAPTGYLIDQTYADGVPFSIETDGEMADFATIAGGEAQPS